VGLQEWNLGVRGQPGHGDRALTYLQISPVFIAHESPIDANCGAGCGSCFTFS
jgi:hypothetical protein